MRTEKKTDCAITGQAREVCYPITTRVACRVKVLRSERFEFKIEVIYSSWIRMIYSRGNKGWPTACTFAPWRDIWFTAPPAPYLRLSISSCVYTCYDRCDRYIRYTQHVCCWWELYRTLPRGVSTAPWFVMQCNCDDATGVALAQWCSAVRDWIADLPRSLYFFFFIFFVCKSAREKWNFPGRLSTVF